MAISVSYKEEKKRVYENLDKLLQMCNERAFEKFINEESSGRLVSLDDIQRVVDSSDVEVVDKTFRKNEDKDLSISIMFLGSKFTDVDLEEPHSLHIDYVLRSDSSDVGGQGSIKMGVSGGFDTVAVSVDRFLGLEGIGVNKKADAFIFDIVDRSSPDDIYNIYVRKAGDIIRRFSPVAYHMFYGKDTYHRKEDPFILSSDGRIVVDRGGNPIQATLYVTYDPSRRKFRYAYCPSFILRAALDEYIHNRKKYKSLESCYIYCLSFFIIHEMMHLIDNNVTSKESYTEIDLGDSSTSQGQEVNHNIANIVQDSYINCGVARLFNSDWSKFFNSMPDNTGNVPRIGVNSRISLRSEHNNGFKKFGNVKELAESITDTVINSIGLNVASPKISLGSNAVSLEKYEGADVFIHLDVLGTSKVLRQNSAKFQKLINDLAKTMTNGSFYNIMQEFTTKEKVSDMDILEPGTLVRIKNTTTVLIVTGYDEASGNYSLNTTNREYRERILKDGSKECKYIFSDTGSSYGTLTRDKFVPYDQDGPENVWVEPVDSGDSEDEKLDSKDVVKAKANPSKGDYYIDRVIHVLGKEQVISTICSVGGYTQDGAEKLIKDCEGKDRDKVRDILGEDVFNALDDLYKEIYDVINGNTGKNPPVGGEPEKRQKVLRVGDIVYVKSLGKFGKIVSSKDGQFTIEEVQEIDPVVLDDSDNY